jgi:hypothetical protein
MVRRHPHLAALGGYVALSAATTWPLLARFGSEIAGDRGDAWQTLWGFWWWRERILAGASPFTCDALRWPWGTPLWLQTWDLPSALALLPAWSLTPAVSPLALYNAAVFASFPLAGFTAYLLCRELWGGDLAAFLAGALYTFSTYHFAHALGHLHLASLQWSPLYLVGLVWTVRRRGVRGPLTAGAGLALAGAASLYHLAFCLVATAVLLAAWVLADRRAVLCAPMARRGALLVAAFALLLGWDLAGMVVAARAEPYAGVHDAVFFSADLQAFFVPNAASAWREGFDGWRAWSGNDAESAAYVGYVALALAAYAGVRLRAARPWLAVAAVGAVLSLGPRLHVGGSVLDGPPLPYALLVRAVPPLAWSGVPTRFTWLVTLGVSVAAGATLAALARGGRRGAALACALAALALVEGWPHAFVTSRWPAPRYLQDLAADAERWAVLDATAPTRQLWHQMLHRHPQVGGYVTRAPERLERLLAETPVLRAFYGAPDADPPPPDAAVRALQDMNVRFVVVDGARLPAALALGVRRVYRGDGLQIFEIPPRAR